MNMNLLTKLYINRHRHIATHVVIIPIKNKYYKTNIKTKKIIHII